HCPGSESTARAMAAVLAGVSMTNKIDCICERPALIKGMSLAGLSSDTMSVLLNPSSPRLRPLGRRQGQSTRHLTAPMGLLAPFLRPLLCTVLTTPRTDQQPAW